MDPRCEELREQAPELALGIVEGEERGRALEHLADCPDCRRRVEELSEVADELLLLAPHKEVPVGFESRVLSRVLPSPPPRRRRRRLALVLAPAASPAISGMPPTITRRCRRRTGRSSRPIRSPAAAAHSRARSSATRDFRTGW
jgi:anti-sigma factor RsiW